MQSLAENLMGQRLNLQAQPSVSAITGQASTSTSFLPASGPRYRVGLWPIMSKEQPETAMGLASLLGFLLERWSMIRVYRLFAQIDDEQAISSWKMNRSQFVVDDWQLDALDENVAVWGTLETTREGFELKLEVENDLDEDTDDTYVGIFSGKNVGGIVAQLPQIARNIADYLDAGENSPIPAYQTAEWQQPMLETALRAVFEWELHLLFALAGKAWTSEQQIAEYRQLLDASANLEGDLGAWMAGRAAVRLMSPLYAPLGEQFAAFIEKDAYKLEVASIYRVITAIGLYRAGLQLSAFDLLEADIEDHPESKVSPLVLAELYTQSNELGAALDAYQRAIEAETTSVALYMRYGELAGVLDAGGVVLNPGARRNSVTGRSFIEGFALIDPDKVSRNRLKWEAVEAYRAAIEIEPDNVRALSQLLMQLADLRDAQFWGDFRRLVEVDEHCEAIRGVVDVFYNFEDVSEGISILKDGVQKRPNQSELRLSLAAAYLLDEQNESARTELEKAVGHTNSPQILAEIDRLMLSVDDPEFEVLIGEITEQLDAGNQLDPENVEYLEAALEKAPSFAPGYLLLANAYLLWGETSDAMDVLLDGQKQFPDDPEIAALLARVLWQAGEAQLALDCLNKALAKNSEDVPLLALTGQFLFEDGQEDSARLFLSRAEAINSRNPVLTQVRAYIANRLDDSR